jgi:hypothetical protein
VTPLQHVQNDRCRMMHSPVTRDQKWRNRNLVIFPPFSTPQGGERGGNQKVPLTANSSQVPVECVGILRGGGGQAPTLFREYSPPKSEKKFFVGFRTTFGSFRIRSAISVRSIGLSRFDDHTTVVRPNMSCSDPRCWRHATPGRWVPL